MPTTIHKKDVDALANKLEQFAETLPEQEQNVLGWLMYRAQNTAESELSDSDLESVAGGTTDPISTQLGESLGFGQANLEGESEITVGWKYKF